MVWSFDPNLSRNLDKVRFKVGDVKQTDQLVADETIEALLATDSVPSVSLAVAEHIYGILTADVDKKVGDAAISSSQRAKAYARRVTRLERELAISGAIPYAGGISKADKETHEEDTDRVEPLFTRDLFVYESETLTSDED
jgi:hypothetical protein